MDARRRTILFTGNCQIGTLADLYRRRVAPLLDEQVSVFGPAVGMRQDELSRLMAALEQADVVVDQRIDSINPIFEEFFLGKVLRRVRVPYLSGRPQWPFGGVAHIKSSALRAPPGEPRFPYDDTELGDSFLNQMIDERVAADEAIRKYDDVIAGGRRRILRIAELHLEQQQKRDAACDMAFADLIAANYQREPLFLTQGHPALLLARVLVEKVFVAVGVPYSLVDAAVRSMRISPFPRSELPIHPAVGEVLGLGFATPDRKYQFDIEGRYTFEEYCRRYLAELWEADAWRGLMLFRTGDFDSAILRLQAAHTRCEGSAMTWRSLAQALARRGQAAAAADAIEMAIKVDPSDPETFGAQAEMLARWGDASGAEAAARRAIDICPFVPAGHLALAEVLGRQGRRHEAAAVGRFALAIEPGDARAMTFAARYIMRAGELEEAGRLLRRALELEPDGAGIRHTQAELDSYLAQASAKAH